MHNEDIVLPQGVSLYENDLLNHQNVEYHTTLPDKKIILCGSCKSKYMGNTEDLLNELINLNHIGCQHCGDKQLYEIAAFMKKTREIDDVKLLQTVLEKAQLKNLKNLIADEVYGPLY